VKVDGCEQLELALFDGVPWGGRSPRGLTRGSSVFIFQAGAGGHGVVTASDNEQLELWPTDQPPGSKMLCSPKESVTAPTMLPLNLRRRKMKFFRRFYYGRPR